MSKALVIRGADFSENAVAQVNINLPYDAEVEYLQGDGSAYIKTGINATSNTTFEVVVNIQTPPDGSTNIIGSREKTSSPEKNLLAYYAKGQDNSWNFRYGANALGTPTQGITGDFTISNISSANILNISGAMDGSVSCSASTFSGGKEMYLFVWNKGDDTPGTIAGSALKIKRCKIYQGQNLVRNFIPVRIGTVGYLYDRVSRTFFGNAAESGAFVLGPDK